MTSFNFYQPILNTESDSAHLRETVDLVKSQPVVVVSCRWTKPISVFRPVLHERHRTSSDLPLHQDPTINSQQRQGDSRVSAQGSGGCLLVGRYELCTYVYNLIHCINIVFELRTISLKKLKHPDFRLIGIVTAKKQTVVKIVVFIMNML